MDKAKEHALVAAAVAVVIPTAFGHPCVQQGDAVAVCAFDPGHPADFRERLPRPELTKPVIAAVGTPSDLPVGRTLIADGQRDAHYRHPAYLMLPGNSAPLLVSSFS